MIAAGKALNVRATRKSKSLEVGKADFHPSGAAPLGTPGLPPLLGRPNTFLCKPAQMNTDKTDLPPFTGKVIFLARAGLLS